MPTQKLSTKTLKSKISLEKRLQFYSLITRKSEDYLSNILGKETFQSLKNCELTGPEIQQINQDLELKDIFYHLKFAFTPSNYTTD